MIDPFEQFRLQTKGVYIATKTPNSTDVLVHATDYEEFEKKLGKQHLTDKPIAVQYLEPKRAICAY